MCITRQLITRSATKQQGAQPRLLHARKFSALSVEQRHQALQTLSMDNTNPNGRYCHPKGALIVIGGHEDKTGEKEILRQFVSMSGGDRAKLVIMTTASQKPKNAGREYEELFWGLGARAENVSVC